ncbi:MAG: DEAD/DEAH box helicase [Candidatus Onthovivens sp.]|nr:DEAD/DEAH box helicase [Candidatus Onthovivens sp.]
MNFAQLSKDALIDSKSKKYTEVTINDELPIDYDINENPEIKQTYDYIKQNSPVIFLTGGAGTGKSTFIKYLKINLKKELNKNCIVLAPTGVAAVNVGGQTIHSFFNFKTDVFENNEIKISMKNSVLDYTDLIIIDEISMVSSWMIDHIDYALRLWFDKNKAFGGKQMLLIGDCFQLPPIAENNEIKQKYFERWDSPFFFAGKVFETVEVEAVQLKKIYRQKDDEAFIHILNRIRKCEQGYEKDIEFLNENYFIENRLKTKNVPDECLLLTTKNNDAEKFNTMKMFNLQQNGAYKKTYEGYVSGKFNFEHFLTPQTLDLCVGAKVMITKNISNKTIKLANGDMGKVVGFGSDYVEVEVKNENYRLYRETWNSLRYTWDNQNKRIQQVTEGSFTQIPLKLGWAVTIHKSQGLTLDAVAIDAADVWDSGQIYVALSRARNLNGVLLRQKISPFSVKADRYIKKIYETLFPESENQNVYNAEEYKNIIVDNSIFTIDKKEELTSVLIGNKKFELYPSGNVKIQQHVQETMELLLTENLVPYEELQRLLTDNNYCYETFGINWNGFRYTLLKKDRNSDTVRYWAKKYGGYYICSQWYQNCSSKFAQWLIKLSKMENKKNSKVVQKVHIIKKGSDEWKNSILRKNEIDNT